MEHQELFRACASERFASTLLRSGPFASLQQLIERARIVWWQQIHISDWLLAFAAHPRLGKLEPTQSTSAEFLQLSVKEQAGTSSASKPTLSDLAEWQQRYEDKFGHVFLLCASGRSADEMLLSVKGRIENTPAQELIIAAGEQMKITELRLAHLWEAKQTAAARRTGRVLAHLQGGQQQEHVGDGRSPITSHVLDIARGCPAQGVLIQLELEAAGSCSSAWRQLGAGRTNQDGRVPDLLPASHRLEPGCYRVTFHMEEYMSSCHQRHPDFYQQPCFYPQAEVRFTVAEHQATQHFHIPLTWSPYGYTTYRGS